MQAQSDEHAGRHFIHFPNLFNLKRADVITNMSGNQMQIAGLEDSLDCRTGKPQNDPWSSYQLYNYHVNVQ